MTSQYDQIIKHLGCRVYLVDARGSSGGEKPKAWIKCMKCDEIIVMATDTRMTIQAALYEVRNETTD